MSELLAALPRLFSMRRANDYEKLRRAAQHDAIARRAIERTVGQMNRAYVEIIPKENDSRTAQAKHS